MAHETKIRRRRGKAAHAGADADGTGTLPDERSLLMAERYMPWVVGAIALMVYLGTMTPGMQMGDGTELAAAAYVLGVPHPTGYPLYMMLCKLWLVLTIGGEVIARTTMLNCLIMAGAAGLTSVIIKDLVRVVWRVGVSKPMLITAALTGLLTAFLRFHWENAVVTEVYALQFLLTLIFVRIVQRMDLAGGPTRRGLIWLTVVFALAMAHHRLSVTLILPWVGVWVWAWRSQRKVGSEKKHRQNSDKTEGVIIRLPWLTTLVILVAGASLYLYIPLRAAQQPPINWGNVTSASAFYNHVRGTEYLDRGLMKPGLGQEFSGSAAREFLFLQTRQILGDLVGQLVPAKEFLVPGPPGSQKMFILSRFPAGFFGFIFLVLSLWGYYCGLRGAMRVTVATVLAIAGLNLAVIYVYNIADIRDYYLLPFWAVVVGILLFNPKGRSYDFQQPRARIGNYVVGVMVLIIAGLNYPRANRSNDISAELLSATILPESSEVMPSGSILITDDDSETFTTWYRQHVRGDRLDVLNFAGNFVYMPWYRAFFTREQIEEYQIRLAPHVARSAAEYTQQLRDAIIDKNAASRAIFTSINDPPVLLELSSAYDVEPVDVVPVVHRMFSDEPTTTVLYRISPKESAAQ